MPGSFLGLARASTLYERLNLSRLETELLPDAMGLDLAVSYESP